MAFKTGVTHLLNLPGKLNLNLLFPQNPTLSICKPALSSGTECAVTKGWSLGIGLILRTCEESRNAVS